MSIYQHFRPEEKDFIDQVYSWRSYVENAYSPKLTDFLDPREQKILQLIIGENQEIKYQLFGGHVQAERKRALLFPDYFEPEEKDFHISLMEVEYPKKFVTIEHPQVLGSVMSLGLDRSKFGDILMEGEQIQLILCGEIKEYVGLQLESIGKAKVQLKEKNWKACIQGKDSWIESSTTVSSLRLDTVVAGIYNISRQKAQQYIQQGYAKVNFTIIENTAFLCEEGDLISVRGQGRSIIKAIEGKTKKDKWRIVIGKM
ncbi:RNA-binding protein [Niallia sp. NCCP-28]|uniref:YlmH family RNA-binding protein n=1 Tax=Niallia sp. NCCP-28 TaxID=2934712 RepID=UPI0020810393|nr:RNA-binding protein [Niallia sp. NCCP-28]GKU82396.1 RNA-binding protein S4 [Niallia sp. NCCP-28]